MTSLQPLGPEHPRFGSVYRTVIAHVVSGEEVGIENYAQMIPLARSREERLHLLEDAWSERGHLAGMLEAAASLGLTIRSSIDDGYWGKVRKAFRDRAGEGDIVACYVIQDIVLESLAVTFYRALAPGLTPSVGHRLASIAEEERTHLEHGAEMLRGLHARDEGSIERAVEFANENVGRVVAEWMRPRDCQPVCGVCSISRGSCFKEDLSLVEVDIGVARSEFTALYGETLRVIGFSASQVTRWVARLMS